MRSELWRCIRRNLVQGKVSLPKAGVEMRWSLGFLPSHSVIPGLVVCRDMGSTSSKCGWQKWQQPAQPRKQRCAEGKNKPNQLSLPSADAASDLSCWKLLKEYLQAALHGHFSTAQLVNDSKSGLVTAPEIKPILPEEESLRTEKSGCIFSHHCLCTSQSRVNKANLLMRNMSIKWLLNVLEAVTTRCFD